MKLAGYTYLVQELDLSLPPLGMELGQGEKSKDEIRPYGSVKIKILAKSKKTGSDIFEKNNGVKSCILHAASEKQSKEQKERGRK